MMSSLITKPLMRVSSGLLEEAKVIEDTVDGEDIFHYRVSIIWWYLACLQINGTLLTCFKYLPKIAAIVLVIPHSNIAMQNIVCTPPPPFLLGGEGGGGEALPNF